MSLYKAKNSGLSSQVENDIFCPNDNNYNLS